MRSAPRFAHAAKAELVSIDYRLAPEHVWPAAFDDCFKVLQWLLADGRPLVVAGDSAGGNLAAGMALKARAEDITGIAGQVLIYPGWAAISCPAPILRWARRWA